MAIQSNEEQKMANYLLAKTLPCYRQGYSDRTAWLMAYLSELAYIKYEPPNLNATVNSFLTNEAASVLNKLNPFRGKLTQRLVSHINMLHYDHKQNLELLKNHLKDINMQLEATFNTGGTQAILVSDTNNSFLALAFRGTEMTSVKDIKTDCKARITNDGAGGKIHSGFKEAFELVDNEISAKLGEDKFKDKPLFITGHSLGGALATVAAKRLQSSQDIAGCYTFGSPRVADAEWISSIKAPLYRIVNAFDGVTLLPPSSTAFFLLELIKKIRLVSLFPGVKWLIENYGQYLHAGDMRYLTNCPTGKPDDVKLLYSVSFLFRVRGFIQRRTPWRKFLSDHAIKVYRKKLMIIAKQRNPDNDSTITQRLDGSANV